MANEAKRSVAIQYKLINIDSKPQSNRIRLVDPGWPHFASLVRHDVFRVASSSAKLTLKYFSQTLVVALFLMLSLGNHSYSQDFIDVEDDPIELDIIDHYFRLGEGSLTPRSPSPLLLTTQFELLNKLSAKRYPLSIPIGSSHTIHDIRIVPQACYRSEDAYRGVVYKAPIKIYLEQDNENEPIELYSGEMSSNPIDNDRLPIEHPIYDLILKNCE